MEGKRDLGREGEGEGERERPQSKALEWKLPSELVVSAISSVAAIFMVAISRLRGGAGSQDKCLRQNELQ